MTTHEILTMALEALLPHRSTALRWYTPVDAAIDAIMLELAKPAPEPVGHTATLPDRTLSALKTKFRKDRTFKYDLVDLYTEPPQPKSDGKAVDYRFLVEDGTNRFWTHNPAGRTVLECQALYTSVPHRQEPVGYFSYSSDNETWEECSPSAIGEDNVFPLYR